MMAGAIMLHAVLTGLSWGSPTSQEFERCDAMSSSAFKICLEKTQIEPLPLCFTEAQRVKQDCKLGQLNAHLPHTVVRNKAELLKRERLEMETREPASLSE